VYTVHTQLSSGQPRWIGQIRSGLRAEAGDGVDLEQAEVGPAAVLEFLLAGLGQEQSPHFAAVIANATSPANLEG